MDALQATRTLTRLVEMAADADARGAVTDREQALRDIEDLPLSPEYICAALDRVGLTKLYRGPKARPQ